MTGASGGSPPAAGRQRWRAGAVTTLDGRGLFLTPGLIDSHVHPGTPPGMTGEQEAQHPELAQRAWQQMPRSFLLYGFTTLVDLISPWGAGALKSRGLTPDTYFRGGAGPHRRLPDELRCRSRHATRSLPYISRSSRRARAARRHRAAAHTPAAVVARACGRMGLICVKTLLRAWLRCHHAQPAGAAARDHPRTGQRGARRGLLCSCTLTPPKPAAVRLEAGVDILAHGLWNWNDAPTGPGLTPGVSACSTAWLTGGVWHGKADPAGASAAERDLPNPFAFLLFRPRSCAAGAARGPDRVVRAHRKCQWGEPRRAGAVSCPRRASRTARSAGGRYPTRHSPRRSSAWQARRGPCSTRHGGRWLPFGTDTARCALTYA